MYKTEKKILKNVLYVVSGLVFAFAIYSFYDCYKYIKELVDAGSLTISGNLYSVVNYYVTYSGMYFIYSLVLLTLAKLIKFNDVNEVVENNQITEETNEIEEETEIIEEDDDLGEAFQPVEETSETEAVIEEVKVEEETTESEVAEEAERVNEENNNL